jgi:methylated-DNA-[protein]-cysteine S-methyltransferase
VETAGVAREFLSHDMEILHYDSLETPIGFVRVEANNSGICAIGFQELASESNPCLLTDTAIQQLRSYFQGELMEFSIPLLPIGTSFEKLVWNELTKIPYGETCSYLDIANRMNNPKAIRAIGRANGANPIAIVIPCHRVVGADGTLVGYSGELWRKRWLLDHEARATGRILL